jgi:hypothetical protein
LSHDPLDMTGLWHGAYVYPAFAGPTTPFVANIVDRDGIISGTIIEPNLVGFLSEELEATIAGSRSGRAVDFIKTYDGKSDANNSVDYVGQVSAEGDLVTGVWSYESWDGTFEMRRDARLEEVLAADTAEELVIPGEPQTEFTRR